MHHAVAAPPREPESSSRDTGKGEQRWKVIAGLDASLERTEIRVPDGLGTVLRRGVADTHPEIIAGKLARRREGLVTVGPETGSTTPWLARGLRAQGLPVVVTDARGASNAPKARPVNTDRADARALAEMLRPGR